VSDEERKLVCERCSYSVRLQALKEFSKARLRKRAQSNILRRGPRFGRFPSRAGFGAPDTANKTLADQAASEASDALFLIREEIAVMKKLNHPNLVQLIEVLDDPEEDSLYMVLEMCKKGVIMKVGLDETAEPYPEEACRCWFRDLILGIEYCELPACSSRLAAGHR
jgi:calcium/calmodulin-dependent protein kinase kinase 2